MSESVVKELPTPSEAGVGHAMTEALSMDASPAPAVVLPAAPRLDKGLLASPERFFNRELSWLKFNERVLEEAENVRHPLLERLRFLSISANNLDEFYMVRVAGLKAQLREGVRVTSQDGLTPSEQLARVTSAATDLMSAQERIWASLKFQLSAERIQVVGADAVTRTERAYLASVFEQQIFPVLTPLAIDPAHPFPFLPNLAFALALKLKRRSDGKSFYAMVPAPNQVRRFWALRPEDGRRSSRAERRFVPLEDLLALFLDSLFPGCDVEAKGVFRIIRDSDV